MKKILALAMVLSVLGSILVGCGSSSTDDAAKPADAAAPKDSTPKDKDGE